MLLVDAVAAGRPQLIDLCVVELIVCRNARVSDQPLWWGRGGYSFRHRILRAFRGVLYK